MRLTDQQNAWIMRVYGAAPGRDRLAAEKSTLEDMLTAAATEKYDALVASVREFGETYRGQWNSDWMKPETFDQGVGAAAQDVLALLPDALDAEDGKG